jgi:hypothetical protein
MSVENDGLMKLINREENLDDCDDLPGLGSKAWEALRASRRLSVVSKRAG